MKVLVADALSEAGVDVLAQRFDVDVRTVRRDVDKLRTLGCPVHSTPGVTGGYRLGAGAALARERFS